MTPQELLAMAKVIPINKNSTNIIFIDNRAMSLANMETLAEKIYKHHNNIDLGGIVAINGNPNECVRGISIKDIKDVKDVEDSEIL